MSYMAISASFVFIRSLNNLQRRLYKDHSIQVWSNPYNEESVILRKRIVTDHNSLGVIT